MKKENKNALRLLPSMDSLLGQMGGMDMMQRFSHAWIKHLLSQELDVTRQRLLQAPDEETTREELTRQIIAKVAQHSQNLLQPAIRRVINATGIILHTGLGRAPYSRSAQQAVHDVMSGYSNLEFDLESGDRGERNDHISDLLCHLTGAEAAVMVNNNAAAVFLTLNALCSGKEVIVSRGQLIEIGGSFRLPDVMSKSGAVMHEVGTTNKTRLKDYEKAINNDTAALFVAHTSNYRVVGFTEEAELADLARLAHAHQLPLIHDLGGGVLMDLRRFDLPYEPLVQDSIQAGADVISFSGDKILGGPQAGIIVGKKEYIERIHSNPIMRAVRCGKVTFAAMEATLKLYLQDQSLFAENKTLAMLVETSEKILKRAEHIEQNIKPEIRQRYRVMVLASMAQAGSGALPLEKLASVAVVLTPPDGKATELARKLRTASTAVVGYIKEDKVWLDARTIDEQEVVTLGEVLHEILQTE
jgi:L-seryl-tRNA(Ser) seleniumtransferase